MDGPAFTWRSFGRTHQGNVRDHNEDAILDQGDRGLWVVADGMGGHHAGDVASQMIVESLARVEAGERPSEFVDDVEDSLLDVNRRLYDKSMEGEEPTVIGSTVATLLAFDRYSLTAWVGDSRVYRLRDGRMEQISRDHSEVEELIQQGVIDRASAESHPSANVITRAVGGAEKLFVDFNLQTLADRDRYLLCSDGLYKDLTEEEIGLNLREGGCEAACTRLLELALSRTCSDNVSVMVVDFSEPTADPTASRE